MPELRTEEALRAVLEDAAARHVWTIGRAAPGPGFAPEPELFGFGIGGAPASAPVAEVYYGPATLPPSIVLSRAAALTGLAREEIDVTIAGELLTVAGRKEKEEKVERKDYHRLERSSGAFTRTITLPAEVEIEKVTATFTNGVLEIRAPKSPEAKSRTRKIAVT